MILLLFVFEDNVFATLLLESNPPHSILFKVCLILLIMFCQRETTENSVNGKDRGESFMFLVSCFR